MKKKYLIYFIDGLCREPSVSFKSIIAKDINWILKEVVEDSSLEKFVPSVYKIVTEWERKGIFDNISDVILLLKSKGIE